MGSHLCRVISELNLGVDRLFLPNEIIFKALSVQCVSFDWVLCDLLVFTMGLIREIIEVGFFCPEGGWYFMRSHAFYDRPNIIRWGREMNRKRFAYEGGGIIAVRGKGNTFVNSLKHTTGVCNISTNQR